MTTEPEHDLAMESLLAGRRALDATDRAAVEALRGDVAWPEDLAARLVAAARSAIRARGTARPGIPFMLRIRALGARIEAVFGEGRVLAPALVRGEGPGGVLVAHRLGDFEVATHADVDGDRFVVMMDIGGDPGGTQVSIARDGRELASEIPRHGRWLLPRLSEGSYRIAVRGKDGAVAELDLVLERSAE